MSAASTVVDVGAQRLAQLAGEVGQVLAHARLQRRGLGARSCRPRCSSTFLPRRAAVPWRARCAPPARAPAAPASGGACARLWRMNVDSRSASASALSSSSAPPLVRHGGAQVRHAARPARARRGRRPARAWPTPGRSPARARSAARCLRAKRIVSASSAVVEQIGLGDHEDQPIARRAQDALLEELPLRRGQDLRGVEQEDRGVGARHVAVGDLGALLVDVVDARRVDDGQPVREDAAPGASARRGGSPRRLHAVARLARARPVLRTCPRSWPAVSHVIGRARRRRSDALARLEDQRRRAARAP